ncbi:MAG: acyltransferase [Desulfuromonadaceae bacterium]
MRTETLRITAEISEPQRVFATLMDHTLSRVAVPVVFFYRQSVPEQALIDGLRRVLNAFPVFASSPVVINDRLAFDCNNRGVDFVVTHRSESMAEVIPRANQEEGKRLAEIIQPNRVLSGADVSR